MFGAARRTHCGWLSSPAEANNHRKVSNGYIFDSPLPGKGGQRRGLFPAHALNAAIPTGKSMPFRLRFLTHRIAAGIAVFLMVAGAPQGTRLGDAAYANPGSGGGHGGSDGGGNGGTS